MPPQEDRSKPWNDAENAPGYKTLPYALMNPCGTLPQFSPDGFGLNHFAANSHVLNGPKPFRLKENDTANTILVGEVNAGLVPWGLPNNSRDPSNGIKSDWGTTRGSALGFGTPSKFHTATVFGMVDGSVRNLNHNIDPEFLRQLSVRKPQSPADENSESTR